MIHTNCSGRSYRRNPGPPLAQRMVYGGYDLVIRQPILSLITANPMPGEMCAAWYHTSTSRIALIADFLRRTSTETWPSLFLKAAVWVVVFEF